MSVDVALVHTLTGMVQDALERESTTRAVDGQASLSREAREAQKASGADVAGEPPTTPGARPALLGTCHAYALNSPVVKRRWPEWAEE